MTFVTANQLTARQEAAGLVQCLVFWCQLPFTDVVPGSQCLSVVQRECSANPTVMTFMLMSATGVSLHLLQPAEEGQQFLFSLHVHRSVMCSEKTVRVERLSMVIQLMALLQLP